MLNTIIRFCCLTLCIVLLAALLGWAALAPLAWILRDGLGPNMKDTEGLQAVSKFGLIWGLPGVVLLIGFSCAYWRLSRKV
jgi:hypothetical protein